MQTHAEVLEAKASDGHNTPVEELALREIIKGLRNGAEGIGFNTAPTAEYFAIGRRIRVSYRHGEWDVLVMKI